MRSVLAIGAYERDNFGDYLFLEVLKRALPNDNVLPGSVIAGDVRKEYGFVTIPYDYVLRNHTVDAVWVVGGEVGGVRVPVALDMSLGAKAGSYESIPPSEAAQIEKLFGASREHTRAYIPNMSVYPKNRKTPIVINSVGLRNLFADTPDNVSLLDQAKAVVVRDEDSFEIASHSSVQPRIAPDVVHALSYYYKPRLTKTKGSVLIQINADTIDKSGVESIREMIKSVYKHLHLPIVLFPAGLANGHDSLELYKKITKNLADVEVSVLDSRNPLEIVNHIMGAHLVIATSLHVRIVAATYGVPRISLENEKVARYVAKWDEAWPFNIHIDATLEAVDRLGLVGSEFLKRDDLAKSAYDNLQETIRLLPKSDQKNPLELNELMSGLLVYQQDVAYKNLIDCHEHIANLESVISEKSAELERAVSRLQMVEGSKAWKAIGKYRRIKHAVRRGKKNDE